MHVGCAGVLVISVSGVFSVEVVLALPEVVKAIPPILQVGSGQRHERMDKLITRLHSPTRNQLS
jgi:hypothetical protein